MEHDVPAEARPVARVLLLGPEQRLLLLLAQDDTDGHQWWVTPGGGLAAGESFQEAAHRELHEETGLRARIGQWVWTRRHAYWFNGLWCDQYERFFVATTTGLEVRPIQQDSYVRRHRWWSLPELAKSTDEFAPRRLPELFGLLAGGDYPAEPIDCGV